MVVVVVLYAQIFMTLKVACLLIFLIIILLTLNIPIFH
ncbi:putative membrane protein [Vibrio paracholerae HE-16]|nr:putative membrane protein [Vibrio paracholerae HE-16]EMP92697.1 putative membrane protein [Vibrio paracholerae 87395]